MPKTTERPAVDKGFLFAISKAQAKKMIAREEGYFAINFENEALMLVYSKNKINVAKAYAKFAKHFSITPATKKTLLIGKVGKDKHGKLIFQVDPALSGAEGKVAGKTVAGKGLKKLGINPTIRFSPSVTDEGTSDDGRRSAKKRKSRVKRLARSVLGKVSRRSEKGKEIEVESSLEAKNEAQVMIAELSHLIAQVDQESEFNPKTLNRLSKLVRDLESVDTAEDDLKVLLNEANYAIEIEEKKMKSGMGDYIQGLHALIQSATTEDTFNRKTLVALQKALPDLQEDMGDSGTVTELLKQTLFAIDREQAKRTRDIWSGRCRKMEAFNTEGKRVLENKVDIREDWIREFRSKIEEYTSKLRRIEVLKAHYSRIYGSIRKTMERSRSLLEEVERFNRFVNEGEKYYQTVQDLMGRVHQEDFSQSLLQDLSTAGRVLEKRGQDEARAEDLLGEVKQSIELIKAKWARQDWEVNHRDDIKRYIVLKESVERNPDLFDRRQLKKLEKHLAYFRREDIIRRYDRIGLLDKGLQKSVKNMVQEAMETLAFLKERKESIFHDKIDQLNEAIDFFSGEGAIGLKLVEKRLREGEENTEGSVDTPSADLSLRAMETVFAQMDVKIADFSNRLAIDRTLLLSATRLKGAARKLLADSEASVKEIDQLREQVVAFLAGVLDSDEREVMDRIGITAIVEALEARRVDLENIGIIQYAIKHNLFDGDSLSKANACLRRLKKSTIPRSVLESLNEGLEGLKAQWALADWAGQKKRVESILQKASDGFGAEELAILRECWEYLNAESTIRRYGRITEDKVVSEIDEMREKLNQILQRDSF